MAMDVSVPCVNQMTITTADTELLDDASVVKVKAFMAMVLGKAATNRSLPAVFPFSLKPVVWAIFEGRTAVPTPLATGAKGLGQSTVPTFDPEGSLMP